MRAELRNDSGKRMTGRPKTLSIFCQTKAKNRETYVSAEQSASEEEARVPGAHAHATGPRRAPPPSPQGSQTPRGLTRACVPAAVSGERLLPEEKLLRRSDYQRCYREGRRRHGPLIALHFIENECWHPRLGITASRKVGNSVVRHLLKRRIRELYRRWPGRRTLPAVDIVVHLKPPARESSFDSLGGDLMRLLRSVDVGDRRRRKSSRVER